MSDLIGEARGSKTVDVDAECPECDSENIKTKDIPGIDLDSPGSVWCDDCGYGWWI